MIDSLKEAYPIKTLCEMLHVPRSSYYAAKRACGRIRYPASQIEAVRQIAAATRHSYGSRRMAHELTDQGHAVGRYRARTLMRQAGVGADRRRRHRYRPAGPMASVAPNRLGGHFQPAAPNCIWAGDITYVPTQRGWLYLAIVVDLYARCIVGAAFSHVADAQLVVRALDQAWRRRQPPPGLLFHSDQGGQYTSLGFQATLERYTMVQSMSRRGHCWDNAVVERVFRSLKSEWIGEQIYRDHAHAQQDVGEFVYTYYNHCRLHAAIGQRPPAVVDVLAA